MREDQGLMQIDAPISPGSSGGPVVNAQSEVIGIAVSSLLDGQNLNFAVEVGYLAALHHDWDVTVQAAGALAVSDREDNELKGHVQTVQTSIAYFDGGQFGPTSWESTMSYNYDGNLTDHWHWMGVRGKYWYRKLHWEYGKRGLRISQTCTHTRGTVSPDQNPETGENRTFTEAEAIQDKIERARLAGVVAQGSSTTTYDSKGNAIEVLLSGDVKEVSTFDENACR